MKKLLVSLALVISAACSYSQATGWKNITFSVYSPRLHGSQLASRGTYNRNAFTCASNLHKLGTRLELKYKNRTCIVTVNDRIAKRFTHSRIDLSSKAFKELYPEYDMSSVRAMNRTETLLRHASYRTIK